MDTGNELIQILKDEMFTLTKFKLSCIFNDYMLKDYKYKARTDDDSQIIQEWFHKTTNKLISLKDIRIISDTSIIQAIKILVGKLANFEKTDIQTLINLALF